MTLLKYYENEEFSFEINDHSFVTIMGNGNNRIISNLVNLKEKTITIGDKIMNKKNINYYRSKMGFILNDHMNIFTSETVEDELAYGLENMGIKSSAMHERVLESSVRFNLDSIFNTDPRFIGSSKQVLVKIAASLLLKPKILVLDNILDELDKNDKELVIKYLIEYIKEGNTVLNFTSNIEDSLYSNYMILTDKDKILAFGKTIPILKEEKLMKRLGFSLPFIFDLNTQLMYYGLIDSYHLKESELVSKLWK